MCLRLIIVGGLYFPLRIASRFSSVVQLLLFALASAIIGVASLTTYAQQTNPVDRKVTNPMTDTPNVNPLTQDQPVRPRTRPRQGEPLEATDELKVDSSTQKISGPENARVFVHEGNVDARIGTYRLQADKVASVYWNSSCRASTSRMSGWTHQAILPRLRDREHRLPRRAAHAGGTQGVGRATTNAVVASSVAVHRRGLPGHESCSSS